MLPTRTLRATALATPLVAALGLAGGSAAAQPGLDPTDQTETPFGPAPQPGGAQQKKPETHAATGAETPGIIPTQPAQLPEKPNEIPPSLLPELHSDFDDEYERGRSPVAERRYFGVYYEEESGDYSFRVAFPWWFERRQDGDRASLFGLNYFNRRSREHDADVFFPFFWKLRDGERHTTVVFPVLHGEWPTGHDNWIGPLVLEGAREETGTEYLHIPPLLTFSHRTARDGFQMVGPAYCKWQGGARCDARTADDIDLGLAPFYFYGRNDDSEYEVIPPLLHYFRYTEIGEAETDVWGPVWLERSREGGVTNVLPLFWHNWGENEAHTTVFPFVHYGWRGSSHTLATPLFVHHEAEDGADTFATYVYARHRGRTELDMVTPLFWWYRDPDIELSRLLALPFFYRNVSPRSDDWVAFPFAAHFLRHGISDDWWITPLFRHKTSITGWETDLLPIFYFGREATSTHLVVAPLLWDFASPKSRQTVFFPLYWRFGDRESVSQLVGQTYYHEEKVPGGTEWEVHFFPLWSWGESPQGHWWNLLYGLVGFTREGTMAKMRILYIPIELSEATR
jgi:hypothetical protein